jgi:hypothetical protein
MDVGTPNTGRMEQYQKDYFGRGKGTKLKAEDNDLRIKRLKKRRMKIGVAEPKFEPIRVDELGQQ